MAGLPRNLLQNRTAVSERHGFAFWRVPKAAGSTITASLYHAMTGERVTEMDRLDTIKLNAFARAGSIPRERLARLYRFTFVRHPVPRTLSAYRDVIARRRGAAWKRYKAVTGARATPDPDEFLRSLESTRVLYTDPHWAPQSAIVPVDVDDVGKVASAEACWRRISRRIFGAPQPLVTVAAHATGAALVGVTPEQRTRIETIFAEDFERFGYE
jgi:hypothetical protein